METFDTIKPLTQTTGRGEVAIIRILEKDICIDD